MWRALAMMLIACGRVSFEPTPPADSAAASDVPADDATLAILSCTGLPDTCGPQGDRSCCESPLVEGGTFLRGYDVGDDGAYPNATWPATLSAYRLDRYEVTVGRFRAFLDAGGGTQVQAPAADAGAVPGIAGSGWDSAWNTSLEATRAALETALICNGLYATWTATAGANENRPIDCITFFEAAAFCAWDGGFLPTEAQSMYATGGGDEQRAYPWSNPPSSVAIDCTLANYGRASFPSTACFANGPQPVGALSPQGDARWGHADLGGNVAEFLLDWRTDTLVMPCDDCANLTPNAAMTRSVRDGSFIDNEIDIRAQFRDVLPPAQRHPMFGVRCARP